jgi:low affinity Fe/Cu permease
MAPAHERRSMAEWFRRFAVLAASALGTHWAFSGAVLLIIGWAATGPLFQFGESWQLVINTGTTIITFLMVFLIQTTQNRDSRALHLKLDELIRSSKARNTFADLEDATDSELDAFQLEFAKLRKSGVELEDAASQAKKRARHGAPHVGTHGSSADQAAAEGPSEPAPPSNSPVSDTPSHKE